MKFKARLTQGIETNTFDMRVLPCREALDQFKISFMLACDYVHPALLGLLPPAIRQVGLQHVVLIALVGKLQTWWAMLGQKGICACGGILVRHVHVGALVAFVLRVPPDRADGTVEVHLQYAGMPQRVIDGLPGDPGIACHELAVPLGCLTSRHDGEGHAVVKIGLPVRKVKHQAQVVPGKNAGETCAQVLGIRRLDVLVRTLVDAELRLTAGVREQLLYRGLDVAEQLWHGKALGEKSIPASDDGIANCSGIGVDERMKAAIGEAEVEYVAWRQIREALQQQLSGQLAEVDNGIFLLVAHYFAPLHALGALRLERQCCRLVLEWFVAIAVANVSRHLR